MTQEKFKRVLKLKKEYAIQVRHILDEAAEKFEKGKKSVTISLPSLYPDIFYDLLFLTAYNDYNFSVRPKLFGRAKIFPRQPIDIDDWPKLLRELCIA